MKRKTGSYASKGRQMLSMYENGKMKISLEKADILARLYDVSINYIYEATDERGTYQPMETGTCSGIPESHLMLFRLVNNWSLEEAAERIGIHSGTLSKYELGTQSVTYSMAQKIAEVYGVPVSSVVGPTVPIVFSMEILSMVLSIQRNRDLLEIFRLCQADPSKVEKCLSILKEDI